MADQDYGEAGVATEPQRIEFRAGAQIFAHLGAKAFEIVDISQAGVDFYSDIRFDPGQTLLLSALGMIALDVEVASCEMEETNPNLLECRYMVRTRYGPRVNGYQVTMLARETFLKKPSNNGHRGNHGLQANSLSED